MKINQLISLALFCASIFLFIRGPIGGGAIFGPPPTLTGDGVEVLIVRETDSTAKITSAQTSALASQAVRSWLKANTLNGSGWRMLDPNTSLEFAEQRWKEGMTRPRDSDPWIIVSNTRTGFEGPLPADETAILALLDQYKEN